MSFQAELLGILKEREESFTDYIVASSTLPMPAGMSLSPEEVRQMVSGFWHLVREGITGTSREIRDMYVSSVFPGLRDTGTSVQMMVSGSARTLFHVFSELVSRVSEPNRAHAQEWLAQFFSDYLGEMAQVWSK